VRDILRATQDRIEANPDQYFRFTSADSLSASRQALSKLVKAPPTSLVFVPNATTAINTVLRNIVYKPRDKILIFPTIYGACLNTVLSICETTPASYVKVSYTYPVSDAFILATFEETVTRERAAGNEIPIAVFDTIVSMPGVRMPFEALTAACRRLGILSCIDGAHCVGQLDMDLTSLDPDFLVSNCHKWLYVPRGCAMFYVPARNQELMRTSFPTSHGFVPRPVDDETGASAYRLPEGVTPFTFQFDFVGTLDNSPYMCVPAALKFRETVCGGEAAIRAYCSDLAKRVGMRAAEMFGTEVLENEEGSLGRGTFMVNVRLPLDAKTVPLDERGAFRVVEYLLKATIDVSGSLLACMWYAGSWWVRFSAQVYLELEDFEWGVDVMKGLCEGIEKGDHLK